MRNCFLLNHTNISRINICSNNLHHKTRSCYIPHFNLTLHCKYCVSWYINESKYNNIDISGMMISGLMKLFKFWSVSTSDQHFLFHISLGYKEMFRSPQINKIWRMNIYSNDSATDAGSYDDMQRVLHQDIQNHHETWKALPNTLYIRKQYIIQTNTLQQFSAL